MIGRYVGIKYSRIALLFKCTYAINSWCMLVRNKTSALTMDETHNKAFPYDFKELDSREKQALAGYYLTGAANFVHIGPKKYLLGQLHITEAVSIYNLSLRPDDTFTVTFPKTGTTMAQELIWLLNNNLDYEKAASIVLTKRFPYLEFELMMRNRNRIVPEDIKKIMKENSMTLTLEEIEKMPSPRFIKSHLPLSLLPPSLLDTVKVVYVARDPRDVAVSYYHHNKLMKLIKPDCKFKEYWKYFISDSSMIYYGPYLEHVLEAWGNRKHPNMLFLFYEDLTKNFPAMARRMADFFGKTLSNDQVMKLVHHFDINNFKKNNSVNFENLQQCGILAKDGAFIRKGKPGGWRDYFDEEMTAEADEWIASHLRDTDLRFPQFSQ